MYLQRFTCLGVYAFGLDKASRPQAQGSSHKPLQSWYKKANDLYVVSFGEAQFIPSSASVILYGCAPTFA